MSGTIDRQRGNADAGDPQQGTGVTVILTARGDRAFVRSWLEGRGLRAVPMLQGFQAVGTREIVDRAFGGGTIPEELTEHVAAVQPVGPKYIHR